MSSEPERPTCLSAQRQLSALCSQLGGRQHAYGAPWLRKRESLLTSFFISLWLHTFTFTRIFTTCCSHQLSSSHSLYSSYPLESLHSHTYTHIMLPSPSALTLLPVILFHYQCHSFINLLTTCAVMLLLSFLLLIRVPFNNLTSRICLWNHLQIFKVT